MDDRINPAADFDLNERPNRDLQNSETHGRRGGLFMTEHCAHDRPGRIAFAATLPRWLAVDCSDSPTAAMTQDYLRPCLTNAPSCLQAARTALVTPWDPVSATRSQ